MHLYKSNDQHAIIRLPDISGRFCSTGGRVSEGVCCCHAVGEESELRGLCCIAVTGAAIVCLPLIIDQSHNFQQY